METMRPADEKTKDDRLSSQYLLHVRLRNVH